MVRGPFGGSKHHHWIIETQNAPMIFGRFTFTTLRLFGGSNIYMSFWMRPTLGNYFEVGVGSKIFF